MSTSYAHRPSATADGLVAVVADSLWLEHMDGPAATHRVDDAIGHPTRPIVAVVEEDPDAPAPGVRVRLAPLEDPQAGPVLHRGAGPLRLLGWWDEDVLALAREPRAMPGSAEVLTLACDGRRLDGPNLVAVASVDHAADGRRVLTTSGPHPLTWNGHRGGGAGRVLLVEPEGHRRMLDGTGNAADAVLLGGRVHWIDDLDGTPQVYSADPDRPGDVPYAWPSLGPAGVTSLRRAGDRLVAGALGRVFTLRPDDAHAARWEPVDVPVPAPRAPGEQDRSADGHVATTGGWTVDTAPGEGGDLFVLEHRDRAAVVVRHASDGRRETVVATGPGAVALDRIVHGGGVSAVSGDAAGVFAVVGVGDVRVLDGQDAHRRSRPAVSPDGRVVAWTREDDLQGGELRLHDLATGEDGRVTVSGFHVSSPVFAPDGSLFLTARPVSELGGTAAPMQPGRVLRLAQPVRAGTARGADLDVLPGEPGQVHELRLWNGVVHALGAGGRWASVSESPTTTAAGESAPTTPPSSSTDVDPAPGEVLEEALRLIRHAAGQVGVIHDDSADVDAPDTVLAAFRDAAARARTRTDLADLLDHAVGTLGASHAVLLREEPPAVSRSDVLLRRAASVLEDHARHVALTDVSVAGWRTVRDLVRGWRGHRSLVLDLRFNEGGQFADALGAVLTGFIFRSATARAAGGSRRLLPGPSQVLVLIAETTGSGGEHLAAILRSLPGVTLLGRRTAGAGTGFHRVRTLGPGLRLCLPQYRLGGWERDAIENHGVTPHVHVPADPLAGDAYDDELLRAVVHHLRRTGDDRPAPTTTGGHP